MITEQRDWDQEDRPAHETSVGGKVGDVDPAYNIARIRRGDTTQDSVHTTLGKFAKREGKLPTKLNEPWQSMDSPSTTHWVSR